MVLKCENCSEEFKCYPSSKRKYCSRKCFETKRPPSNCIKCGIEFKIPGQPKQKYCSAKCYHKDIKGTFQRHHKHNLDRKHLLETKDKMSLTHRLIRAKWVMGWVQGPMFNVEGCNKILEYGKKHNYKFQTAINGGEYFVKPLGYWLDGYDFENNVVIEYMEKHHQTPRHMEKDKIRKKRIMECLSCKFIEIWE